LPKKSSISRPSRVPPAIDGIQVNYCKNPRCLNYGVPPLPVKHIGRKKKNFIDPDMYIVTGNKKELELVCMYPDCRETLPMKSNLAVSEEYKRIKRNYDGGRTDPAVHNEGCPKFEVGFYEEPGLFYKHTPTRRIVARHKKSRLKNLKAGEADPETETKVGYRRYRCKECGKTFTLSSPISNQEDSFKNKWIFKLLMNKVPLRRICELVEIDMWNLYAKIRFIHRQCLAFAAEKEKKLFTMKRDRAYICVDRQDHKINWSDAADRANVALNLVGSADMRTGYIYGTHLNFDPFFESREINHLASANGDLSTSNAFRKFARLWLDDDYREAALKAKKLKAAKKARLAAMAEDDYSRAAREEIEDLFDELEEESLVVESREDVESPEVMTKEVKLPTKNGMQVHEEYVLYGHFRLLADLMKNTSKVRFYMDKESPIRAALLTSFCDRIKAGECDGFFVRIEKQLTIDQRRRSFAKTKSAFKKFRLANKDLSFKQAKVAFIMEEMARMRPIGKWKDRWLMYPFPSLAEPQKAVCFLTDFGQYDSDPEHLAWLYEKASMHAIDRFFMQARRRISMLERPIRSASSTGRAWFGYNAYNPWNVQIFMDIFRVFYNFVKVTEPPPKRKQKRLREAITQFETECGVRGESLEADGVGISKGEVDPEEGDNTLAAALTPATPKEAKQRQLTTPAMRIGLAKRPTRYEDILYFK